MLAKRPYAHGVLHDQYWQHDRGGLHRIDHEHEKWERQRANARQSAFREAEQDDCRCRQQIEDGVLDHVGLSELLPVRESSLSLCKRGESVVYISVMRHVQLMPGP